MDKKRTLINFATVQIEGERRVKRKIEYFNLDMILAIGYRVNMQKQLCFVSGQLKFYIIILLVVML